MEVLTIIGLAEAVAQQVMLMWVVQAVLAAEAVAQLVLDKLQELAVVLLLIVVLQVQVLLLVVLVALILVAAVAVDMTVMVQEETVVVV
jgi:hypothetical protein